MKLIHLALAVPLLAATTFAASSVFADETGHATAIGSDTQEMADGPPDSDWGPRRAAVPLDRRGNPRLAFAARDGQLPPPGYQLEERPLRGLMYGGIGGMAGAYAFGAIVSGFDYVGSHGEGPWAYALIPAAGPFIAVAMDRDSLATGFYIASGILQNASLALLIVGATVERPYFVATGSALGGLRVGVGPSGLTLSGEL